LQVDSDWLSANSEIEPEKTEVKLTAKSSTLIERIMAVLRMPAFQYGLPVAAVLVLVSAVLYTTMRMNKQSLVAVSQRAPEPATKSIQEDSNPESKVTNHGVAVGNTNNREQRLQPEAGQPEPKPNSTGIAEETKHAARAQDDERLSPRQRILIRWTDCPKRTSKRAKINWKDTLPTLQFR